MIHRPRFARRLARQAPWLIHLAGLLAALGLAALLAAWALTACAAEPAACGELTAARGWLLPIEVGALLLGAWTTRDRRPARALFVVGGALAAGLIALGGLGALPPLATLTGLLLPPALALLGPPLRAAEAGLRLLARERRQWWRVSLHAARLTRRMLGAGAYHELCRTGHIRVASSRHPGRVYLVPRRTSPSGARVLVEEHGRVIGGLCLRPREPLPDPEEVVAHVLLLRGDERAYLSAANFFPYDTALTPQATARRL